MIESMNESMIKSMNEPLIYLMIYTMIEPLIYPMIYPIIEPMTYSSVMSTNDSCLSDSLSVYQFNKGTSKLMVILDINFRLKCRRDND